MNYEIAANILAEIKPARRKRERYRQRDEMQHRVIPLLPADAIPYTNSQAFPSAQASAPSA